MEGFAWFQSNGTLVLENQDVRIYKVDSEDYLFIGQILYASSTERDWYLKNVLPYAKGRVLEAGLGLGVASKIILSSPEVERLITIEVNPRIIESYKNNQSRHFIVNYDFKKWVSDFTPVFQELKFDLIFVDTYYHCDEDLYSELIGVVADCKKLLRPDGKIILWLDELIPEEEKKKFLDLNVGLGV